MKFEWFEIENSRTQKEDMQTTFLGVVAKCTERRLDFKNEFVEG